MIDDTLFNLLFLAVLVADVVIYGRRWRNRRR